MTSPRPAAARQDDAGRKAAALAGLSWHTPCVIAWAEAGTLTRRFLTMPRTDGTGPQGKGPGTGGCRGGCAGKEAETVRTGRGLRPGRPRAASSPRRGGRKLGWRAIFGPNED